MALAASRPDFTAATVSDLSSMPGWVKFEESGQRTMVAKKSHLGLAWEVTDGGAAKTAMQVGDQLVLMTATPAELAALLTD